MSGNGAYVQDGIVTDPQGAASGSARVIRGGGWFNVAGNCIVGAQTNYSPVDRFDGLGFRLACLP